MPWQFNSSQAVFIQISDKLRRDIINGKYPPNSQIPSVRQLAFDAAVNPNTMQKALCVLEEEGLLKTQGTIGRFITSDLCVLEAARKKVREETIKRFLEEARSLDISSDELIEHIKKEDQVNEHSRS